MGAVSVSDDLAFVQFGDGSPRCFDLAADPTWLLDPKNNALAAAALWAGNNKNLSVAWYAELEGAAKSHYEAHLAAAQTAALAEKP